MGKGKGGGMRHYIITTDKEDQNWLDGFNDWAGHTYQMDQEVKPEHLDHVEANIYRFNNEVACGPAIELKEVAE